MFNEIPPVINIEATGFPDAWYKAIKACMDRGAIKWRDYGSPVQTRDIISTIQINNPFQEPMLHLDFPTKGLHMQEYMKQFDRHYDWKKQGFEYSYIDRLTNYPITEIDSRSDGYFKVARKPVTNSIDQISVLKEKIAQRIKKGGDCLVSNRDQAVTWVVERDLFVKEDQPCLQRIQIFVYSFPTIEEDKIIPGKAEYHVTWRSRDLYGAWNSNLVALTSFLDKEIFAPNNLKIIRVVDFANSLHIYEADWESAKKVRPAIKNPQMMR